MGTIHIVIHSLIVCIVSKLFKVLTKFKYFEFVARYDKIYNNLRQRANKNLLVPARSQTWTEIKKLKKKEKQSKAGMFVPWNLINNFAIPKI